MRAVVISVIGASVGRQNRRSTPKPFESTPKTFRGQRKKIRVQRSAPRGVARQSRNRARRRTSNMSKPAALALCGSRLRQMRHAIFFAVPGNAKVQIGIAQLRGAADCAAVQRVVARARMRFKLAPPHGNLATMPNLAKNLRSEENEKIGKRRRQRGAIRV